ncbi:uncharacterized protein LOC129258605 [Lytechinus pictus]|uniref:uncharacterized protein LOC129258605 n=1 Tax=Lytechinus pictus TaxID=7653 RepID=UPI0030B9B987
MAGYYNYIESEDHQLTDTYSENPLMIDDGPGAYTETKHYTRSPEQERGEKKGDGSPSSKKMKTSNHQQSCRDMTGTSTAWTQQPMEKDGDVESEILFKCPISSKQDRRKYVVAKTYLNKVYVDIREYFEKNSEFLPTKKGVTLTAAEFMALCKESQAIHKILQKKCMM